MSLRDQFMGAAPRSGQTALDVDRIACKGHGVCANLVSSIDLDEWGYPLLDARSVDPAVGAAAIRLCPARALRWK